MEVERGERGGEGEIYHIASGHLQARETALARNGIGQRLDIGLPASITVKKLISVV